MNSVSFFMVHSARVEAIFGKRNCDHAETIFKILQTA